MRQIFKTHPWVPPKELPETQELFRKYGVPGSIRPGHLLKGKGEPSKLYLITRGAAAYYVADRYKSHPSVLSLLIPGVQRATYPSSPEIGSMLLPEPLGLVRCSSCSRMF